MDPTTETGQNQDADRWLARIAEVEEKFNVDIVEKQGANTYDYNSNIVTSILSGDPIGHLISVTEVVTTILRAGTRPVW